MILGMNVLEFVLVTSAVIVVAAWCADYGPEIYDEQKAAWQENHPKKERVSENTVTMPVGSFDPETTTKIRKFDIQEIIVLSRPPVSRGRHARV